MSCCAHPSEIPQVLQDTPALDHTRVLFFQGEKLPCPWAGRSRAGAGWAEQGAQGCREVLGVQRGTHWGSAEPEGHSRMWGCLVGLTKAQWGQREGGEAQQWGAVGNRVCSPSQELLHCSGDGRKEERRSEVGVCWDCCRPSPGSPPLCSPCFQGTGCRIRCKRQRHDLHVKLNSP